MFAIVADVERYPEFLPWCAGLRILSRSGDHGCETLIAEMLVGYMALRERYTSRVLLNPRALTIDVTQNEGPFRKLENHWRFIPQGSGCNIEFLLDFEFSSRVLGIVAGRALAPVMMRMSEAFEQRAKALSKQPLQ
jgi:coenzyme Q-binding protein COQ10